LRKKIVISVVIAIIWFVFAGFKLKHYYLPPGEVTYVAQAYREKVGVNEYNYAIYMRDTRIGHMKRMLVPTDNGMKIFEEGVMRMSFLGEKKELRMNLYSDLDKDFRLNAFALQVLSDQDDLTIRGQMTDGSLAVLVVTKDQKTSRTIAMKERPLIPSAIVPFLVNTGYSSKTALKIPVFDPSILGQYEAEVVLLGWEKITVDNEEIRAFHAKTLFKGIELHAWVDESGGIVKEVSPIGIVVQKERPGKDAEYLDINLLASVETAGSVADPRKASYLKARLDGSADLVKVVAKFQRLTGNVFEVERGHLPKVSLDPASMLAPTPFINSDDMAIRAALLKIMGSTTEAPDKVAVLMSWVHANMRKTPTFSIPLASDVFKKRAGDCNEHAVLFAAMARATGIPCAIASGMVYSEGHFYYHAWNVVFVNGRWTDVDATFGQFPADATHIILALGDITDGIEVLQFVRKSRIQILEAR
jgi:hypothetical protein